MNCSQLLNRISFGCLVMFSITSTFLNPCVFLFNRMFRQSIASRLFQALAVLDFFTNLSYPIMGAYHISAPQPPPYRVYATKFQVSYCRMAKERVASHYI